MKAVPMTNRPKFPLMILADVQNFYHLQMPRWLYAEPYRDTLSLEAKVAYTFLLNRFQLSRLNGWMNDGGEVFVIYTRKALAVEMGVSYHKIIAAMKELVALDLIWEMRCGRGDANQIYLAKMEHTTTAASVPFVEPGDERSSDGEFLDDGEVSQESDVPAQEIPMVDFKKSTSGTSRNQPAESLEVPLVVASNTDQNYTDEIHTESSQSVLAREAGSARETKKLPLGETDGTDELEDILAQCDLELFTPEMAKVFSNAIERLFYSDSLHIGKAILPQCRVRSRLHDLDFTLLQAAEAKLHQVLEKPIRNSTAYTMAVVFNTIVEAESDLLVDPYLNSLRIPEPGGGAPPCF